jgi:uncharacterized protein (DUF1330 family)
MPGYVIVGVEWHSAEAFDAYARDVERTIEMFGGRYIVGTRDVDVREGSWRPKIVAVLEFDSVDAARAWYESEEYGGLREIRKKGATTDHLILVDGLE